MLEGLVEWDARCIDAHAHLGGLAFDEDDMAEAQAHYATGVRIAEGSLPNGFGGVLGWGWIDNRPFLRCLHGLTISTWRLEQHTEARRCARRCYGSTRPITREPASCSERSRRRTLARQSLNPSHGQRTDRLATRPSQAR